MAFLSMHQSEVLDEIIEIVKRIPEIGDYAVNEVMNLTTTDIVEHVQYLNTHENTDEAAKRLGLKTYDTALPQPWVDLVFKHTKIWAPGLLVWSYDGAGIFGKPVAVCPDGEVLLEIVAEMDKKGMLV